jgi:hypothetical protein
MRFLIVLALFSVPLVYAGLSDLGGVARLIDVQRQGKIAAGNTPPAAILGNAKITPADQVDDDLGFFSSKSAVPVSDSVDVLHNDSAAAKSFANVRMEDSSSPKRRFKTEAGIEDNAAPRVLTNTTDVKNPPEIIEEDFQKGSGGI